MHFKVFAHPACVLLLGLGSRGLPAGGELSSNAACEHYAQVERELEAGTTPSLTADQRAERLRLLGVLHEYRTSRNFGVNVDLPFLSVPQFVDPFGRRCAVAALLDASGEDELVLEVQKRSNTAWVVDLAADARFLRWLDRSGLSLEDAARIQLPTRGVDPSPSKARRPPGKPEAGQSPSGPSAGGGKSGAAPNGGGAPGPGGRSQSPTTSRNSPATDSEAGSDWSTWWEYNKLAYLRPHVIDSDFGPMTGDDPQRLQDARDPLRRKLLPLFIERCADSDASVRAAAVLALGRVGGASEVAIIVRLLEDPNTLVRERAILALGATGAAQARTLLLDLAKKGTLSSNETVSVDSQARALAIVSLAVGRHCGFDASLDAEIALLAREPRSRGDDDVRVAAMLYQRISPCDLLEQAAVALMEDRSQSAAVRSAAIAALGAGDDAGLLSKLQTQLGGLRPDLRGSAALAIGGIEHGLALPALLTAFEMEANPAARGLLCISIGRQGGKAAREFLLRALTKEGATVQPFCALGLGILAREHGDSGVSAALLEQLSKVNGHEDLPAFWLALGLARDPNAHAVLAEALSTAADPWQRMYAATALGLLGTDQAVQTLRERASKEGSDMARAAILQAVALEGEARDVPLLVESLVTIRDPEQRAFSAAALGTHGQLGSALGLEQLTRATTTPSNTMAAGLEALGMCLSHSEAFTVAVGSRQAQTELFPPWMNDLFQCTL